MSDAAYLAKINAIPITKNDMWDLAGACEDWHREHPEDEGGFETGFFIIATRIKKGEHDKGFALWSRMNALANLISGDQGAPGWTWKPKDGDGRVFTAAAMFSAAAVEPLLLDGNECVFDRARFLDRVLELAESETRA